MRQIGGRRGGRGVCKAHRKLHRKLLPPSLKDGAAHAGGGGRMRAHQVTGQRRGAATVAKGGRVGGGPRSGSNLDWGKLDSKIHPRCRPTASARVGRAVAARPGERRYAHRRPATHGPASAFPSPVVVLRSPPSHSAPFAGIARHLQSSAGCCWAACRPNAILAMHGERGAAPSPIFRNVTSSKAEVLHVQLPVQRFGLKQPVRCCMCVCIA